MTQPIQSALTSILKTLSLIFGSAHVEHTGNGMNYNNWLKVYETYGALDAEFLVGRLRAEGIPARAWAESAGRALGLTVGKLGTAFVEVPEPFAAAAMEIIATDFSSELFEDGED